MDFLKYLRMDVDALCLIMEKRVKSNNSLASSFLTSIIMVSVLLLSACGGATSNNTDQAALSALGEKLYFDTNLSDPPGQSCASCHFPEAGFADPDTDFPTSEGAISGLYDKRNAPTTSYAAHIPEFHFEADIAGGGEFVGGLFLDGRSSTLELQAQSPFLKVLEMNMANKAAVIAQVILADYVDEFNAVFGVESLEDIETAYEQISQAIAAFERSDMLSPFDSKFDAVQSSSDVFSVAEQNGQSLFNGKAECVSCHSSENGTAQVFSNFEYRNNGVPGNPDNQFLKLDVSFNPDGENFVDFGLGLEISDSSQNGKFRIPTLRNINETSPYMHNGVFDTLHEVINFYNRRDVDGVTPEVDQNINDVGNIGNLRLTANEIDDLVAFLQTLSDGYTN